MNVWLANGCAYLDCFSSKLVLNFYAYLLYCRLKKQLVQTTTFSTTQINNLAKSYNPLANREELIRALNVICIPNASVFQTKLQAFVIRSVNIAKSIPLCTPRFSHSSVNSFRTSILFSRWFIHALV